MVLTTRWSMPSIWSRMLVYWPPANLRLFFYKISLRSLFSTSLSDHRPQEQSRMRCAGCRFCGEKHFWSFLYIIFKFFSGWNNVDACSRLPSLPAGTASNRANLPVVAFYHPTFSKQFVELYLADWKPERRCALQSFSPPPWWRCLPGRSSPGAKWKWWGGWKGAPLPQPPSSLRWRHPCQEPPVTEQYLISYKNRDETTSRETRRFLPITLYCSGITSRLTWMLATLVGKTMYFLFIYFFGGGLIDSLVQNCAVS